MIDLTQNRFYRRSIIMTAVLFVSAVIIHCGCLIASPSVPQVSEEMHASCHSTAAQEAPANKSAACCEHCETSLESTMPPSFTVESLKASQPYFGTFTFEADLFQPQSSLNYFSTGFVENAVLSASAPPLFILQQALLI